MMKILIGIILVTGIFCVASIMARRKDTGFQCLSNGKFTEVIKNKSTQLVDVRTPEEYLESHIPGSINIDVKDSVGFEKKAGELDKNRLVAVYCKSGIRSAKAAKIFVQKGYKVVILENGFQNWKGEVEKDDPDKLLE